jgi:cholesterol transport system auxiliary component
MKTVLAVLLSGLLGACSILPQTAPLDVYLLPTALPAASASAATVPWSLRVNRPQSSQVLDSSRIVVLPQGDLVSAYQGARWSDRAPVLLRDRLIDAFLADGRLAAVSSDDHRLQSDLELSSDLRAFQSEYHNGAVQVHLQLDVRLVEGNGRQRILASRRFAVRQACTDTSVPRVVSAFALASDQLSRQVSDWVVEQASRPHTQER